MNGPGDIPNDIWEAACAVTTAQPSSFGWRKTTEAVARAIMAERYRCARIAAPLPMEPEDSDIEKQAYDIRAGIEGAILKRGA